MYPSRLSLSPFAVSSERCRHEQRKDQSCICIHLAARRRYSVFSSGLYGVLLKAHLDALSSRSDFTPGYCFVRASPRIRSIKFLPSVLESIQSRSKTKSRPTRSIPNNYHLRCKQNNPLHSAWGSKQNRLSPHRQTGPTTEGTHHQHRVSNLVLADPTPKNDHASFLRRHRQSVERSDVSDDIDYQARVAVRMEEYHISQGAVG